MIYPGSRRSSLFSKILGKVEKKLYQKPLKRSIDDLIIINLAQEIQKEKVNSKAKTKKLLNSELNLIQIH